MPDEVFVIRKNDGLTAPCDCNYIASRFPLEDANNILPYSNLCGARRFPSEKDARESFQQLPAKAQSHHRIERVQPLHLLYFPPYQETA